MSKKKPEYDILTIEQIRNKWDDFCDWLHEQKLDDEHANIEAEIDALFDWAEKAETYASDLSSTEDDIRSVLHVIESAGDISDKIQVSKRAKEPKR